MPTALRASRLAALLAACALGIALVAPTAALADEPVPDPGASTAADDPSPAPTVTPGDGQGEVVIDGPFITPTPEGSVLDAIDEPRLTPPPTDAGARQPSSTSSGAWRSLVAVLAGMGAMAIALGSRARRSVRARAASRATRTTPGRRTRR